MRYRCATSAKGTGMIPNPTAKGKRSEAKILAALVQAGMSVLIPWGEERYDLAVDDNGRLVRIQCKTGIMRGGCVDFKTCIMDRRRPLGDGGCAGQIEAFAVYCPQNDKVYLVPIAAVPCPTLARMRLDPPRNGQVTRIRWAREFELGRQE
jgi:PD-(D/E)XK endonuclease